MVIVEQGREWQEMVPRHLRDRYILFDEEYRVRSTNVSLGELARKLAAATADPSVRNWNKYGPLVKEGVVFVVLVRTAPERLQYLIASLAQARDIHTVMIIFSHSYYDERIERLVATVDFCLVKQIYYPNSVQLYPNSFPGVDILDCSHTLSPEKLRCMDRDGRLAENKHHWWWTANVVFGKRWPWMRLHRGPVVFLREDNYVLPDLVYMVGYGRRALDAVPHAEVMSFGRPLASDLDYDKLVVEAWHPASEHGGLVLNSSMWAKISSLAWDFCTYDDVSWGYSLTSVFAQFSRGRVLMLASSAPRVLFTGREVASGRQAMAEMAPLVRAAHPRLFPPQVRAVLLCSLDDIVVKDVPPPPQGNGGWTDFRDRDLCLDPLSAAEAVDPQSATDAVQETTTATVANLATYKFSLK